MEMKQESISGIFSTQEVRKVGTGTTTRKTIHKSFWSCHELPDGSIEIQPLNMNYIPSGPKRQVTKDQFLNSFSPEPEFYVSNVFPKMKELNKIVARGERHRKNKDYYSAEMDFGNALKIDEENIRANFGLGLTYTSRGDTAKAEDILHRLVKLDAAFDQEHKHLFNEFGIQLRKIKMYSQAVEYYERAIELSGNDENLYYNIARACYENGQYVKCSDYLVKGLDLNPGLSELSSLLVLLVTKQQLPEDKKATAMVALKKAQNFMKQNPDQVTQYNEPAHSDNEMEQSGESQA